MFYRSGFVTDHRDINARAAATQEAFVPCVSRQHLLELSCSPRTLSTIAVTMGITWVLQGWIPDLFDTAAQMYKARRMSPWDNFISFGRICTCISVAIARGVPASAADLIWLVSPLISAADPDFLLCGLPMSDSTPVRCLHTAHA